MSISTNILNLRERIAKAAQRARRNSDEITLMAVTKTIPPERIRQAYEAGIRVFGENRVQEFAVKVEGLRDLREAQWHMIGHLQTNKAAKAVEMFSSVESVDSLRLAQKLNSAAAQLEKRIPVLIEINIGGEDAKSGTPPDSGEFEELLRAAPQLSALEYRGLMTVPPYFQDPEQSGPYFQKMRALFDHIGARDLPAVEMAVLSMGMSHDFEIAIQEGATCVRIGTAIFGERPK